jgi:hypothetical protein
MFTGKNLWMKRYAVASKESRRKKHAILWFIVLILRSLLKNLYVASYAEERKFDWGDTRFCTLRFMIA